MRRRAIQYSLLALGLVVALSVVAGCGASATATKAAATGATVAATTAATKAATAAATVAATTAATEAPTTAPTMAATTAPTTAPTVAATTAAAGALPTADAALAATGATEAQSLGCMACHSTDGTKVVGPTWQGLYGSQVTLTDGSTVLADDAYIRESITNPSAKVVQGYQSGIMPTVGSTLSTQQLDALVAYIESLGVVK